MRRCGTQMGGDAGAMRRAFVFLLLLSFSLSRGMAGFAQDARPAYAIQIAAFPAEAAAVAFAAEARQRGVDAVVTHRPRSGAPMYRVQVGRFKTREQAESQARDLARRALIPQFFIAEVDPRDQMLPARESAPPPVVAPPPRALAAEPAPERKPEAAPAAPPESRLAEHVLAIVARSSNAAVTALRERNNLYAGMTEYRHANGYAYYRPQAWLEGDVSPESLREEGLNSGETFISTETGAFLSSAYRRFKSNRDGKTPIGALTAPVLIEKLISRLQRLPGVGDVREIRHEIVSKGSVERIELELRLSFQPTVNAPRIPFLGRAVVLRNAAGVFELIGLRQQQSPPVALRMIERALDSATLP